MVTLSSYTSHVERIRKTITSLLLHLNMLQDDIAELAAIPLAEIHPCKFWRKCTFFDRQMITDAQDTLSSLARASALTMLKTQLTVDELVFSLYTRHYDCAVCRTNGADLDGPSVPIPPSPKSPDETPDAKQALANALNTVPLSDVLERLHDHEVHFTDKPSTYVHCNYCGWNGPLSAALEGVCPGCDNIVMTLDDKPISPYELDDDPDDDQPQGPAPCDYANNLYDTFCGKDCDHCPYRDVCPSAAPLSFRTE